jgi:hypothetical protein
MTVRSNAGLTEPAEEGFDCFESESAARAHEQLPVLGLCFFEFGGGRSFLGGAFGSFAVAAGFGLAASLGAGPFAGGGFEAGPAGIAFLCGRLLCRCHVGLEHGWLG